jgi:hypothetical protein
MEKDQEQISFLSVKCVQLLEGAWFFASLSVFSDNKNNFHVLTKILLKVAKPGGIASARVEVRAHRIV